MNKHDHEIICPMPFWCRAFFMQSWLVATGCLLKRVEAIPMKLDPDASDLGCDHDAWSRIDVGSHTVCNSNGIVGE